MSDPVPPKTKEHSVPAKITTEVRYAVVMYGGISLCIYINGVAQELLEMARATCPDDGELLCPADSLSASAKIYRRLGQYLDSDTMDLGLLAGDNPDAEVRTRFVIDVLSGTSAGGLNSIFLAKALVNNERMDALTKLWMREGDINVLLNDKHSKLKGLPPKATPESLLNSQRMYAKLLEALDGMDFPEQKDQRTGPRAPTSTRQALVHELDLYVTATDLAGLPVHLKLENTMADEFRHRSVFQFRFDSSRNDFITDFNPLLAFAGRCTSSIPPAFEPMRLEDIRPVLRLQPRYSSLSDETLEKWKRVYSEYAKIEEPDSFWRRDFGDGGFLDNKPFTYATRTLMQRQADHPVQRKLIYIEPSPEEIGRVPLGHENKPDALAHSLAALIQLPRYETIREDVEAVLDRNRLLERVDEVTRDVDRDVATYQAKRIEKVEGEAFELTPLKPLIERYGTAYGVYHRLKVAEITTNLAALVADLLGYPRGAEECVTIRKLVERWRNRIYDENPRPGTQLKPESAFLMDFDPGYRLRRLYFIHRKINFFYSLVPGSPRARERHILRTQEVNDPLPPAVADIFDDAQHPERWVRFREALLKLKPQLATALSDLRAVCRKVSEDEEMRRILRQIKADKESFARCLSDEAVADDFIKHQEPYFIEAASHLALLYEETFRKAATTCTTVLADSPSISPEEQTARRILRDIYNFFDHYDMALFPIQYERGSWESPHVDILRVSPDDACNLCNYKADSRRKLAGKAFFSFGAFFADFWRENDMLWGRLDAADILVRDLLRKTEAEKTRAVDHPGFKGRRDVKPGDTRTIADVVIDDVHKAILTETLSLKRREDVWRMLTTALPHLERGKLHNEINEFLTDNSGMSQTMRSIVNFCQDDEALLSYYKTRYEVDRRLEPKILLRLASRGSHIFGRMLDGIFAKRGIDPKQRSTAMLIRVATIFSGLVELAVPRTAGALLWHYWRALLYFVGFLLLVLGLIFSSAPVEHAGMLILGVTVTLHLATGWLRLWIVSGGMLRRISLSVAIVLAIGLLYLGIWKATELLSRFL